MGNMQYQQTGKTHCFNDAGKPGAEEAESGRAWACTNGTDVCVDAAIDESYQNYLIDYLLDVSTFLEN